MVGTEFQRRPGGGTFVVKYIFLEVVEKFFNRWMSNDALGQKNTEE